MNILELIKWQWEGYENNHKNKVNLLIHIVAVPAFIISTISLLVSLFTFSLVSIILSVLVMAISMGLQGKGHSLEEEKPVPFTSKMNVLNRIFLEQWFTFPRYVFSGKWAKNLFNAK